MVKENWLYKLVKYDGMAQHPLHHLLFIQFMGMSIKEFIEYEVPKPFGEPLWPCLNRVCSHYRQPVIEKYELYASKYTNGRPIAIFSCKCGFIYQRTGPDTNVGDRYRIDKIKDFGKLWKERLQELWNRTDISLREIARMLGVDTNTVKFQAALVKLPVTNGRNYEPRDQDEEHNKICLTNNDASVTMQYQCDWLDLVHNNPDLGIKQLRAKTPGLFTWHYRHNRVWLYENSPRRKRSDNRVPRIDWGLRDSEIKEKLLSAAKTIRQREGKPERITVSSLGRSLGCLALLQKRLRKLPQTAEMLVTLVEDQESFAVRRIAVTVKNFQEKGVTAKRWEIVKASGVERVQHAEAVKDALERALILLNPA